MCSPHNVPGINLQTCIAIPGRVTFKQNRTLAVTFSNDTSPGKSIKGLWSKYYAIGTILTENRRHDAKITSINHPSEINLCLKAISKVLAAVY